MDAFNRISKKNNLNLGNKDKKCEELRTQHRRSQRGAKGAMPPKKFLENIVILCFEKRFSKQNSAIRLKSNIVTPQNFWAGYATGTQNIFESP